MSRWTGLAGSVLVLACAVVAAAPGSALGEQIAAPQWAFPGPRTKSIPGSKVEYSTGQTFDRTAAVDWFPNEHPAMPAAVKGNHVPVFACGFCHLPEGVGRPENAALAGMPYEYLRQQVEDMQSGARQAGDPHFGPGISMVVTVKQVSKAEAEEAVRYYSVLKFAKHTRIVETATIPRASADSFVYVFDKSGAREPLGERIIEGPDDFTRFEMRDPNVSYTAYVPVGATARGAVLAKGDGGARVGCETCHGPGLKGTAIGPPLAGRSPTSTFRQLHAFKSGTRNGPGAAFMKPIVAGLSEKEMIDLATFVGSLEP